MRQRRTEDVRRLYETYSFPQGVTDADPDFVYASTWYFHFTPAGMAGKRVLDAGCGTGNKLVAQSIMFQSTEFTGVELSNQSIEQARKLVLKHQRENVILRQGDILSIDGKEKFDVVQSVGVVHHLEDPRKGLANLCASLNEDGILLIWLYHPLGEMERLHQREILLTLWGEDQSNLAEGQELMDALQLVFNADHYGPKYGDGKLPYADLEARADAFMHPIVNAYTFSEALDMFHAAGADWAAVDFINLRADFKLLNLEDENEPILPGKNVRPSSLFESAVLQERFKKMSKRERLRVVELVVQPRGYLMIGGKGDSLSHFSKRIQGNHISFR